MINELREYEQKIIGWAKERNLLTNPDSDKQRLKLLEEVGETAGAIVKNIPEKIKDGLGDAFVVLCILAAQEGQEMEFVEEESAIKELEENPVAILLNGVLYSEYTYSGTSYLRAAANKLNYNLVECVAAAWDEIKDRKGKTVDGAFIKEE